MRQRRRSIRYISRVRRDKGHNDENRDATELQRTESVLEFSTCGLSSPQVNVQPKLPQASSFHETRTPITFRTSSHAQQDTHQHCYLASIHLTTSTSTTMKRKKPTQPIYLYLKRTEHHEATQSTPPALLELPPELRNMIWELAIGELTKRRVDLRHLCQPAVTRVCKQMRSESMGLIVPALQNKKWKSPLLLCGRCCNIDPSIVLQDQPVFCTHIGDDVRNWSMVPG